MTRTSGQYAAWVMGRLEHSCGFSGFVDWSHDPEVDPSSLVVECPSCRVEVSRPTSEGVFL